jgi:hypothetical protein
VRWIEDDPGLDHGTSIVTTVEPPVSLRTFRRFWTAFVVVVTSAPYALNFWLAPRGSHYTWILPPYPEDSFGYMAWSQQAAHGRWLFQLKYTALPQKPFLFHPFFLLCGWLSALFSVEVGIVHLAMKTLGVVVFLLTLYRYLDYLRFMPFASILASILVGIASGLGWLWVLLGVATESSHLPADLWLVDANTFWSLLWNPLFPYSLTAILLFMDSIDRGTRDGEPRYLWLAGFCLGLLALIHPYQVPLLLVVAALIALVRRRTAAWRDLWRTYGLALPFMLYVALVAKLDPLVARHNELGQMSSPSPLVYAVGFGIPLVAMLAGIVVDRREYVARYWPLLLWVLLSFVFCYLPFWFQRKFVFGVHVPICILAAASLDLIVCRIGSPPLRRWVVGGIVVGLLPLLTFTQIYLFSEERRQVRENADGAYYVPDEVMAGLKFLHDHTGPDEIVFAPLAVSRIIPATAGNTVVWGHWAMSVDFTERNRWAADVFQAQSGWNEEQREGAFWGAGIKYIFAVADLRRWFERADRSWLLRSTDKAFENPFVTIFRHRDNSQGLGAAPQSAGGDSSGR